jgi:YVTN family beta-propeller protein
MRIENIIMVPAILAILFISCEKEKKSTAGSYRYGIFIVNEGSFMANNGSVSYYNPDSDKVVNNIFETINGRPLGDVVQSMGIAGNIAYIVVNGSGKVEVVDLENFETAAEPIIASYPRYFLAVNAQKGYLSNGSMQGYVYIIDLNSHSIADSIQVGFGPETMVQLNDKVYVANSGGWDVDSTLSIIDTNTDEVTGSIVVGAIPVDMTLDKDNNLWVYCKGLAVYSWDPPYDLISETDAILVKINTGTNTVIWKGVIGTAGHFAGTPPKLAINATGDELYFLRPDGIYKMGISNPVIPVEPIVEGSYYGLDVNPQTGDLYLFQASFTGNGNMIIVNPDTGDKTTYIVGIGPNGAVFSLE